MSAERKIGSFLKAASAEVEGLMTEAQRAIDLLQDRRNRRISAPDFRKQIEAVIKDDAARERLLAELDKVVQQGDMPDPFSDFKVEVFSYGQNHRYRPGNHARQSNSV